MKKIIIIITFIFISSYAFSGGYKIVDGGMLIGLAPFTDNFTGTNNDPPNVSYWRPLVPRAGYANYDSSYHVNIQNNALQWYVKNTGTQAIYTIATRRHLPTTGAFFSITIPALSFPSADSTENFYFRIWNSDKDVDNYGSVGKSVVEIILINQNNGIYDVSVYSRDSDGASTSLYKDKTTYSLSGSHTFKLYIVDSTHADLYIDGSKIGSTLNLTCNLGSLVYAGIAQVCKNSSTYDIINLDDADFGNE